MAFGIATMIRIKPQITERTPSVIFIDEITFFENTPITV